MAKKTGAIEIKFDAGGNLNKITDDVKSLKAQVKEAQQEAQILSQKFGATSEQAVAAQKKLAGLKEELSDFNQRIEALNPEAKFKALGVAVQGVAGGFAAAQGAAALLGGESEELQKTMVKLQAALALSQGLNDIRGLGDAFGNLKIVAVDALNGIKKAFMSNPIFFVAGTIIAGLTAAWVALNLTVSEGTENVEKQIEANKELERVTVRKYDREIELARAAGKDTFELEKQKLQATISRIEEEIKLTRKKFELEKQQTIDSLNTQITLNQLFNSQQAAAQQLIVDKLLETTKFKTEEELKLEEELEEAKTKLGILEISRETENAKKGAEAYKQKQEEKKKADEDREKFLSELEAQRLKEEQEIDAREAEMIDNQNVEREKKLKEEQEFQAALFAATDKRLKDQEAAEEKALQRRRELTLATIEIATSLTSTLANLGSIFIKNQEKNEAFQKKVAAVQLAIDTVKAISGAVAQAQSVPFPGNVVAIAAGIAAVTANIKKAKELLSKTGTTSSISLDIPGNSSVNLPEFANQPIIQGTGVNQQQTDTTGSNVNNLQVIITQGQLEENQKVTESLQSKVNIQ